VSASIKIGSIVETGDHGTAEYDRGRVLEILGRGDGRGARVDWEIADAVYVEDVP
jgi:hypothetical protein